MTVALSSLRVVPELDATKYVAGANQKVAADKGMAASAQGVAAAQTVADQKISQAGDVLARLSRQYVEGYASAQRMQSAVNSLSRGIETGKISMMQAEPILEGIFRKYGQIGDGAQFAAKGQHELAAAITNTTARMTAQVAAANAATASVTRIGAANQNAGARNFNASNAAFQVQDVAMMAMMGQSPIATAMQQGPQLAMIMQQGGGIASLAAGLASLVSPTMLITVGLTAATAAAIQWGGAMLSSADKSEKALEGHKRLVDEIAKSYPAAAEAAKQYMDAAQRMPDSVIQADSITQQKANFDAYRTALAPLIRDLRIAGNSQGAIGPNAGYFGQVADALANGTLNATDLVDILGKIRIQEGPINNAKRFAETLQEAAKQAAILQGNVDGLEAANAVRRGGPLGARFDGGQRQLEWSRSNREAIRQAERDQATELLSLGARSPQERAAAARAREQARPFDPSESPALRAYRIEAAGALELARAEKELSDARLQRSRSLDQTVGLQQLELSLIGQTVGEMERLRQEYQLTAQLREEAARNGVAADEQELALIKQKAAELGRIAELTARTRIVDDLRFDREQMFRSPQDQAIASRMRGAGLSVDMNSGIAGRMREMQEFADAKDLAKGFLTDFKAALMSNGGDVGEALGQAILNALSNSLDKQLANIFDRLATMFASWATGSVPSVGANFFPAAPSAPGAFRSAANSNMSPADLAGMGLFNFVPGGSSAVGMGMYRDAIAAVESRGSGDYGAIGPRHPRYGRALGRYQVMETNVGPWSNAALGRSIGADEFLGNPGLQDRIFDHRFGGYLRQHGNPQDAASMWFTGRPLSQGANARDVLGTSGAGYVEKFNAELARLGQTASNATNGLTGFASNLTQVGQSLVNPSGPLGGLTGGFQPNTTFTNFLGYTPGGGGMGMGGGGGMGGGLLGMLFSFLPKLFGFAEGTDNAPPGFAWVGERGPELLRFRGGEQVIPNHKLGAANQNTFAPVFNVDARGSTMTRGEFEGIAQSAVASYHREMVRGGWGSTQRQYQNQKG